MRTCLHLLEEEEKAGAGAVKAKQGSKGEDFKGRGGGKWTCAGRDLLLFDWEGIC